MSSSLTALVAVDQDIAGEYYLGEGRRTVDSVHAVERQEGSAGTAAADTAEAVHDWVD